MLAVIKEESGHMTSSLTKNNNNLMGMKMPTKRPTTAIGVKYGYADYKSKEDAIDDLNLYFETYIVPKGLSRKQAAYYLEKNYSESKGYASRILDLI